MNMDQTNDDRQFVNSWRQYIFVFIAVLIGFAISQWLRSRSAEAPPLPPKVRPYVEEADERSQRAVDESLADLQVFFGQAKVNARKFAGEAVGWGTKWRLMADYVPYTRGDRHEEYIKAKFNEMIFSDEQLAKAVEDTIAHFFRLLESIDSKMLVDIRADLPDIVSNSALHTMDEQLLLETYRDMIEKIQRLSMGKNSGEIRAATVSLVAGEVLAMIAVRLSVTSGVLGTGAATSYTTLGTSLIVMLIIDYVIMKIWDWYADPKGKLVAEIEEGIDNIQTLLLDGAPATDSAEAVSGLRERLTEYARQRHSHREATLRELLKP